jgi:hypothetical protein
MENDMGVNKKSWCVLTIPTDLRLRERLHELAAALPVDIETGRPLPIYVILHRALTQYEKEIQHDKSDTAKG